MENNKKKYELGVWDCSGFVNTVLWEIFGEKVVYGGTIHQYEMGIMLGWETGTDMSQLQQGDLIYWWSKTGGTNHVAIYDCDGYMIDNGPKTNVSRRLVSSINSDNYIMVWLRPNYPSQ